MAKTRKAAATKPTATRDSLRSLFEEAKAAFDDAAPQRHTIAALVGRLDQVEAHRRTADEYATLWREGGDNGHGDLAGMNRARERDLLESINSLPGVEIIRRECESVGGKFTAERLREVAATLAKAKGRDSVMDLSTADVAAMLGGNPQEAKKPKLNREGRKLFFDGKQIAHYKRESPDQWTVLCAFDESGWPDEIDDPLPQRKSRDGEYRDSKEAVARTADNMTRKLKDDNRGRAPIIFATNGNRTGFRWRINES